jgi:hypothetical protein
MVFDEIQKIIRDDPSKILIALKIKLQILLFKSHFCYYYTVIWLFGGL